MKNLFTAIYLIISIMITSVYLDQTFLRKTKSKIYSIEDYCSDFKISKDFILEAKCNGEERKEIDLVHCISYKENTLVMDAPNLLLKDDCKDPKVYKAKYQDGEIETLESKCFLKNKDTLKIIEHTAKIELRDFLYLEGEYLKCGNLHFRRLKEEKLKYLIDEKCINFDVFNTKILSGVCELEGKKYEESLDVNECLENLISNHGFVKDCIYCSGNRINNINIINCTCANKNGATRKIYSRVNELLKLEDGKIKCRNPKLKAKVKSYLIPEYEADSLHVIPKNSEVEVLNDSIQNEENNEEKITNKPRLAKNVKPKLEDLEPKKLNADFMPKIPIPQAIKIKDNSVVPRPVSKPAEKKSDNEDYEKNNLRLRN